MSHPTADLDSEVCQLKDRVRILEAMFHHSRELIFTLDLKSRITGLNETAERALDCSENELIGTPFDDLISPRSLSDGPQFNAEFTSKSGKSIPVEIRKERQVVIAHDLLERQ